MWAAECDAVKLGVTAMLTDETIGPSEFARAVEERGFHSLYLPEHTHLPVSADAPPSLVAGVREADYRRVIDPFVALAAAATVTERILVGTGVSLVAQHEPIAMAKQVATLDLIAGGRFVLGVGFGWNKVEVADHGVAYGARRAVVRERMLCMQALWSAEKAEFHGEHVELPPSWAWPKPVQQPRVRTLVGAAPGPSTFAAIAEYADGWMPIGGRGIAQALLALRKEFEKRGRDPRQAHVVAFGTVPDPGKLEHLAAVGCTEVALRVPSGKSSEMLGSLDSYVRYLDRGFGVDG
jgi:probable F420-dependent oxidoreductase